jgi:hypothetical protein
VTTTGCGTSYDDTGIQRITFVVKSLDNRATESVSLTKRTVQ